MVAHYYCIYTINYSIVIYQPPVLITGGGATLAFVTYPYILSEFDWCPQLFSVLFFLMLFTLGLGSAVGIAGMVVNTGNPLLRNQVVGQGWDGGTVVVRGF